MKPKIYLVGGAVRDALLGGPSKDRDWVVVGATPQWLADAGFIAVGKDFPVFLHPHTHEEYALARTERKTAPGYHGFTFHAAPAVTLEQDLARRDLTINSMAVAADCACSDVHSASASARTLALDSRAANVSLPADQWQRAGRLIDPYGGLADLSAKVLRHVSAAFCEDPVRILRVARLAARFADFSVAAPTLRLMRQMVDSGEVDHLVSERVWQELAKGLLESTPSRMFEVLRDCGALQRLLPEVSALAGVAQRADFHPEVDTFVHLMLVLDMSARLQAPLPVRVACLFHDLGKGNTPQAVLPRHMGHEERSVKLLQGVVARLRLPKDCRELAVLVAREHSNIHRSASLRAAALVALLERCDAVRKPARFAALLQACECDARGRLGLAEQSYPQRQNLLEVLALVQQVETDKIALAAVKQGLSGKPIGQVIHQARVAELQRSGR